MHCDYLNTTVPDTHSDSIKSDILNIASSVGAVAVQDGLYKILKSGTLKIDDKRGFTLFSASGGFLSALRDYGAFASYLSIISDVPHNVSLMHVAHDIQGDNSPATLGRIYKRATGDRGVRLTRKRVKYVKKLMSPGPDGRDTGTVYLGHRRSEVWAKVYDKSKERFDNAGVDVPPCTRYELSVSGKAGASLRDAYSPAPMFWHFMTNVLSGAPEGSEWSPGSQGFTLPPNVALLPAESLRRLLESSPQFSQMLTLADQIGPHGCEYFLRLVNDRVREHQRSTDQPSLDLQSTSTGPAKTG